MHMCRLPPLFLYFFIHMIPIAYKITIFPYTWKINYYATHFTDNSCTSCGQLHWMWSIYSMSPGHNYNNHLFKVINKFFDAINEK